MELNYNSAPVDRCQATTRGQLRTQGQLGGGGGDATPESEY